MEQLQFDRATLRKFGITMSVALLVIAGIVFARGRHSPLPLVAIAGFFVLTALALPAVLKPLYIIWMRFAYVLSWVNTHVLLVILYYLVITPMSIAMRLLGKDLLDQKIDPAAKSYWKKKEQPMADSAAYRRRF